jgi:hypothetical protein
MRTSLLATVPALVAACHSYGPIHELPVAPVPTPAEEAELARETLCVVPPSTERGDERGADASNRLAQALVATELFGNVYVGDAGAATLLARPVLPEGNPCFAEPILTVLTLGIVPHVGCVLSGQEFTLEGGPLSRRVAVDSRAEVSHVFGWIAPLLNVSPSRTFAPPRAEVTRRLRSEITRWWRAGKEESL